MEYIVLRDRIYFIGKTSEVLDLIKEKAACFETLREMIEAETSYSSSVKKLPAALQVKK